MYMTYIHTGIHVHDVEYVYHRYRYGTGNT